jgi:hypothetical protein
MVELAGSGISPISIGAGLGNRKPTTQHQCQPLQHLHYQQRKQYQWLNMQILQQFYVNKTEREAVHDFMVECLGQMAIEKTFKGEDVSGIKEARELVEKMFDELQVLYGEKPKVLYNNSK